MKKILLLFCVILSLVGYAQNGDCPAEFVCTNQSGESVNNGSTNELNASNRGCLTSNEASASHWYRVCFSTPGTFQFTISPSGNNNDYDFAVWNGSNCPPTAAPIRCSYAISSAGPGADNTGVNSLNNAPQTDNSEGAFGNQWVQDITVIAGQCLIICVNNYGTGSNNYDLTFGGTAVMDCMILPIELLSFSGVKVENSNELKWTCASEINNDFFTIERSSDGILYTEIGVVDGAGTSSSITNYTFYDHNPPKTINYYRLKQTDFNGQTEYFEPIVIDNTLDVNLKPIKIINMLGQEVSDEYEGLRFIYYSDGTVVKKVGK